MVKLREDGNYLLVRQVKDLEFPLPDTIIDKCMICGEDVWIAKSSRGVKFDGIVCTNCAEKIPEKDKTYEFRDDTLRELKRRKII